MWAGGSTCMPLFLSPSLSAPFGDVMGVAMDSECRLDVQKNQYFSVHTEPRKFVRVLFG